MKADRYHISNDDDLLLTLIDPLVLKPDDIILIDFPDCKTQQVDNVNVDSSELLDFDFWFATR